MKIDLHCHSKYSKRPTLWIMQKIGCPESFTEPLELYHLALRKGMTGVTITDHNVIDGCLEIMHLPNTLMGCEYTTYFPEDGCKVHVLAYGFSEAQHRDLSDLRENIYDFTDYLRQEKLPHVCAHPLFGPNDRLSVNHVEKLALLYRNWEINGDQTPGMNVAVRQMLHQMNPAKIMALANKHNLEPCPEAWDKRLTAGSDDHSSLHLADAYTSVAGAESIAAFWQGIDGGAAEITVRPAGPVAFARNVYGIAYQFYKGKMGIDRYVQKDDLLRFVDHTLHTRPGQHGRWMDKLALMVGRRRKAKESPAGAESLIALARREAEKLLREDPELMEMIAATREGQGDPDAMWFEFVERLSSRVMIHLGNRLLDRVLRAHLFDLFHSLGSAGALYALVAPYFVSYSHHAFQQRFSQECVEAFLDGQMPHELEDTPRVGHFTDTFDDVNGVARTLNQQAACARRLNKDYTVVTCSPGPEQDSVKRFDAMGSFTLPEYPELSLLAPPFLRMLDHAYSHRFSHIHLATPGPVGLAGLAIARILGTPVSGTYHTAIPQYAKALTDDAYVEDMMWKFMIWFYDQLDAVFVPSKATAAELIERGLKPEKIVVYPRGVDTERFHPGKKEAMLQERFEVGEHETTLLYVGRVSREKNLDILCEAYKRMLDEGVLARLIVTGDGPYREEMEAALAGSPVVFTGYLEGDDLASRYASVDMLVFPSTTDTFGNVVLEAQASGTPVIVSDLGGPAENVDEGVTGFICPAGDVAAFTERMIELVEQPLRRKAMGVAGRTAMEARSFEKAFAQLWELYIQAGSDRKNNAHSALPGSLGLDELSKIAKAI